MSATTCLFGFQAVDSRCLGLIFDSCIFLLRSVFAKSLDKKPKQVWEPSRSSRTLAYLKNEDLCPQAMIPVQAEIHNTLNLPHWITDKNTRE